MDRLNDDYQIVASLKQDHRDLRAQLAKVTQGSGEVAEALVQLARLCLLHFELEEKIVYPLFALGGDLTSGNGDDRMDEVRDLIVRFEEQRDDLYGQHQSVKTAVEQLSVIASEEGDEGIIALTRRLKSHELMEDEIVYPKVLLICKYVQHR